MQEISANRIDRVIRRATLRQHRQQALLGFFALMSAGNLVFGIAMLLHPGVKIADALAPLALSIACAVMLFRSWQWIVRERKAWGRLAEPATDAIAAAIDATRTRIAGYQRLRLLATVLLLPLFAVALAQLFRAGKMNGSDVASLGTLVLVAFAVVQVVLRHRVRFQLEPQVRDLEAIRKQF